MCLAMALALGKPLEGVEVRSAMTGLEFQQDPSCCLLREQAAEGQGWERKDLLSACSNAGERGWDPEPGC